MEEPITLDLTETGSALAAIWRIADAINSRERSLTAPRMAMTWKRETGGRTGLNVIPQPIRRMKMHPATNEYLLFYAKQDAAGTQRTVAVDYMDGKGPRLAVFGIVADLNPAMPQRQVVLS